MLFPLPSLAFVVATDASGQKLRWPHPEEIRFVVYPPEEGSENLPNREELMAAIERAAGSWSEVEGSSVAISIEIAPSGSSPPSPGYDGGSSSENVNAILFETDRWTHQPGAFAVTLRAYGSESARLLHADIVFNAVEYRWGVLDGPARRHPDGIGPVDVQGVVTHELGHALGFEHAVSKPSTMSSTVGYGEIWMRELSKTDREGVRYLYPKVILEPSVDVRDESVHRAEEAAVTGCSVAVETKAVRPFLSLLLVVSLGLLSSRRLLFGLGASSIAR